MVHTAPRSVPRAALTVLAATAVLGGAVAVATPALADPVTVTVTCEPFTADVPRDGEFHGQVTCSTSDGSPIESYELTSDPALGAAFLNPDTGEFTFTPDAGVVETDSFFFSATAGGVSDESVASLTIKNFAPSCAATPTTATVRHDRSLRITPSCLDENHDAITLRAGATPPAHGTLTISSGQLVYTPARRFIGTDTITFDATDGEADSNPVSITATVTNAAPTCTVPAVSLTHDRPRTITATCKDADGDPLVVTAGGARRGTVSRVGPSSFRFVPARRAVGRAGFTVTAGDGLSSTTKAVSVVITNIAPQLTAPRAISVKGRKVFRVTATDRDRDLVTVGVAARPRHGKVVVSGRTVSYVPARGYKGRDTFALRASDGIAASVVRRIAISVRR